jgi:hypothetical protein
MKKDNFREFWHTDFVSHYFFVENQRNPRTKNRPVYLTVLVQNGSKPLTSSLVCYVNIPKEDIPTEINEAAPIAD